MSDAARIRLLLVLAVAILGGSTWLVVSHERSSLLHAHAQTAAAGDLLTAMLEQETGVRGFDQTALEEFLEPFHAGRENFDAALAASRRRAAGDPEVLGQLAAQEHTARRWQAMAESALARVRGHGSHSVTVAHARERKGLMDEFRRRNGVFRAHVRAQAEAQLVRARWSALGLVMLIGTLLLGGGLLLIQRGARRAAQRRRAEREFIDTLQGAEHEDEAQELLQRHVARSLPGAEAVVLRRNASGNVLAASTDPAGIPGLAARLDGAAPRDCLAVRRGAAYDRSEDEEPLQPCGICGSLPGASRCTPSLVGGEVIGSVLIEHPGHLGPDDASEVTVSIAEAAPVISNLRNLAIAELRASTDALTGLPNQRAVQVNLRRMSAQALRSGFPLAAIMFDLDHFKQINDSYGHGKGDQVLATVGQVIAGAIRASDFAGREGGEEFVVLLPATDRDQAAVVAESLRKAIALIQVTDVERPITASFGVAALPDDATEPEALIRCADRALYVAKSRGRNRVELVESRTPATPADPRLAGTPE
jgi:diguanylate cyclase (GGDEF)-like protein